MYACLYLHASESSAVLWEELYALASDFSPYWEQTAVDTVVFSIDGLRKLIGSPHQIASEICRSGHTRKLQANLALAANPDTVVLLARHCPGVTLVTPGEEALILSALPLSVLFQHERLAAERFSSPILRPDETARFLERWGLKTCGDLAALPEQGVGERLGKAGIYLRNLACGRVHRPLQIPPAQTSYSERVELDHPVGLLEPLLFLFARVLNTLCKRLQQQSQAARSLQCLLELEGGVPCRCPLEFPVPLANSQSILKLLQLYLEAHPPGAPIMAFTLQIEAVEPRRLQGGFFLPPTPEPDKLQITLSRIAAMVGTQNVGTPALLNTHRPDAWTMLTNGNGETSANSAMVTAGKANSISGNNDNETASSMGETPVLRLAIRVFRPALLARVVAIEGWKPQHVQANGVKGNVVKRAGPWKTSGDWWTVTAWNREEWDVALDDGALYRIYRQPANQQWFVEGVYD